MTGPLHGLRVLDVTSVIMGPYATAMLGDLGADVLKVELSGGDVGRYLGPSRHGGMSALTLNLHRNKRSIVIDSASKAGQDRLTELISGSDVIITNLRPSSRLRLGLDWDSVCDRNSNVVLCTAQAFSSTSDKRDAPAYDDVIQAVSGTADLYRRAWGRPLFSPSVIADKVCGLVIVNSVLAAVHHVQTGGGGQWVDVPMADTMLAFNLVEHLSGKTFRPPEGDFGWGRTLAPERTPHRAADGWICVMPYSDKNWADFFGIVGRSDLAADERFESNSSRHLHNDALQVELAKILAERTIADWVGECSRHGIAAEQMLDLDEVDSHPYFSQRRALIPASHPSEGDYVIVRNPVDFSATPITEYRPAPLLGQDTDSANWLDSTSERDA